MIEKEKMYEASFQIILHAGDAKIHAMNAINAANNCDFEKAKELILEAKEELKKAHRVQTDLIQNEAQGSSVEINILLVHSQDHFSMALTAIDFAKQVIVMSERINNLEKIVMKGGN